MIFGRFSTPAWLRRGLESHRRRAVIVLLAAVVVGVSVSLPLVGVAFLALVATVSALGFVRRELALLSLLPIVLFLVSPRHQFAVYRLPAAVVLALVISTQWLLSRCAPAREDNRGDRLVLFAALGFVAVMLASYVGGLARPLRFSQLQAADRELLIMLAMVGVAVSITDIVRTAEARRLIAGLLVAGAALSGAVALLQQANGIDLSELIRLPGFQDGGLFVSGRERLGFTRAYGTARHPIEFGTSLALALPFALFFGFRGRSRQVRIASVVATVAMIIGMTISLSRSAIVALVVVALVLVPKWSGERQLRAAVAVAALGFVMLFVQPARLQSAIGLVTNWRGEGVQGVGIEARTEDYAVVAELVGQHPFLGHGFGTHISFATDNEYLDVLIESGVIGVVALLALLFFSIHAASLARREATERGDHDDAEFATCIVASLSAALVSLGTYDGLSFPQFAFSMFIVVGLAGSMRRRVGPDAVGILVDEDVHLLTRRDAPVSANEIVSQ